MVSMSESCEKLGNWFSGIAGVLVSISLSSRTFAISRKRSNNSFLFSGFKVTNFSMILEAAFDRL